MKKVLVIFLLVCMFGLVFAANNTTTEPAQTKEQEDKIDEGFDCLEQEIGDCSSLSIQEMALTILASPDNVGNCITLLKEKADDNHWQTSKSIRDTALAILALEHAGEDTSSYEDWLLEQESIPQDIIWYLEQDSNEASECSVTYTGNDYTFQVRDNKKIETEGLGDCLSTAVSNFWIRINPDCYDTEFAISCDRDFISTLLYKSPQSSTIHVLSDTKSSPALETIKLKVNSKCFGSDCDYESTAWATLALLKTGHDMESYIPYVIAMADDNEEYLPDAFIYMLTDYDNYATSLIQSQKTAGYWQADNSVYGRYYDTALAILALQDSTSPQLEKGRKWALFSQDSNGCWNSIRDTSIMLWALAQRQASTGSVTRCEEAGYYCIPKASCPQEQQLDNYFCSGLSAVCCEDENLQSCSELGGEICEQDETCSGQQEPTQEGQCCLGYCEEQAEEPECEQMGYSCRSSCRDDEEEMSYDCDSGVCCRTKTEQDSSAWWIWVLIILIIIILGVLVWFFRHRLRLFFFKLKSKFGKGKGKPGSSSGSPPSKPGFPPVRRFPPTQAPRQQQGGDKEMDSVFNKLKNMTK
ncbi:MAG: hypothetical protein ACP5D2_02550 [Candidatus Nanoarchaeia archaeon]